MPVRVLVVNGPNLNLLGKREPHVYGTTTLADIQARMLGAARRWPDVELQFYQSNGEGEILDWLHANAPRARGLVINPGGLGHTSVALRDAVAAIGIDTIEVHITNIHAREPFRRRSLLSGVCVGCICGLGPYGYEAALEALARRSGWPEGA